MGVWINESFASLSFEISSKCLIIFHLTLLNDCPVCPKAALWISMCKAVVALLLFCCTLFQKLHETWNSKKKNLITFRHKVLLAGGRRESWQARAGNVKLLYSCHLGLGNEKDDIAPSVGSQTGDARYGRSASWFSYRVSFRWPKPSAAAKVCPRQLLLGPDWVLSDVIIRTPRPACQAASKQQGHFYQLISFSN